MKGDKLQIAGYVLLTVFIVWHVAGISIVGPLPPGDLRNQLMKVYGSYLKILHLDTTWNFYAPNPSFGSVIRYEAVNAKGDKVIHPLSEARHKFDHTYFRYTNFYVYLFSRPRVSRQSGYTQSVVRHLCARHSRSEEIEKIKFLLFRQKKFTRDDYLRGDRPMDKHFLKKSVSRYYDCQDSGI